jgi:Carboxypeptidase regulatory-like domain
MGTYRALLVCLLLLAQGSAQEPENKQFKLDGVVVNSLTGKPLPRVLVQVYNRSLLSGPEGEFSFDGVSPGRVQIMLTKPGYFMMGTGFSNPWPGNNMVDVGPDTGKVTLKLVPEAVIFGHVTGQDEEPLEGAGVQVLSLISTEGHQHLAPVTEVRTDEDGNFRVVGLHPGRYFLAVKAGAVTRRVLGAVNAKSPEAYPPVVYYPGTTDQSAMRALDLIPGQRVEAVFSLSLAPAYRLSGRVVAQGEWGRINPPMVLGALDQTLFQADEFDSQSGKFVFRAVPAGNYTLRVSGAAPDNQYGLSSHKLVVSKNATDLVFALLPPINIPVNVRTDFSKPMQPRTCTTNSPTGMQQSDCSDYPAATVELISVDSANSRFSTMHRPIKEPSDSWLRGVQPGRYTVRVRPTVAGYVQSARSGNLDLLREELIVPEDGNIEPIEIVLRDDYGMLNVSLRALAPGHQATALAFPSGAFPSNPQLALVRNAGFSFTNSGTTAYVNFSPVAPGTYTVFAFDSLDGVDYANPEFLPKYASKAATVTVAPNGNASVAVEVIRVAD